MKFSIVFALVIASLTSLVVQAATPNVVLIVADDMGYADMGAQGAQGFKTPHLDQLATEGTRFTDFYVAQAVCTASRTALMTGCYPNRLGMHGAYNHTSLDGIADSEWLLSEMFKEQGYVTAGMGKWHLGTRMKFHPMRHGFDQWLGIPYSNDNSKYHPTSAAEMPPLPFYDGEKIIEHDPDQSLFTRRFTERAIEFIEGNASRPFFLYMPHVMPHVPIFASEQFKGRSQAGLYGDVMQELDWSVGEILATLRRLKLDENTLVIFISDNGPFLSYGEHAGSALPLREGKLTTFEGGVRVPCLVRWPGHVPAGRICAEPFMGIDWLPTLTEIVDGKAPVLPIDGRSAKGLLLGESNARSPHEALYFYSGTALQAVRSGSWKLHFPHPYITPAGQPGRGGKPSNFGQLAPASIKLSGVEGIATRHGYRIEQLELSLFDLRADPGEQKNVAVENPEVVARLAALAKPARQELGDSLTNIVGSGLRPPGEDKPNIIFVMADDMGWGQTGYRNHPILKTPHLDAMAANGLRFERFYAGGPVCSPTRASVLTGRSHERAGVLSHGYALRTQEKTIAQALQRAGYVTGHFGKWHLNGHRGPGAPIFADDPRNPGKFGFDEWVSVSNFFDLNPLMSRAGKFEEFQGDSSEIAIAEAVKFLAKHQARDKPMFAVIWFGTPHSPFKSLADDKTTFNGLDEASSNHYGELVAMDRSLGTLRKSLRDLNLADNTLLVFCSDNGGLPGIMPETVGGLRGYKGSVFEGGLRVPGIIEWPAAIQPRVTNYPACVMDLFPTVAEIVGLPDSAMTKPLDGKSLKPLFEQELSKRQAPMGFRYQTKRALIDDRFKLLTDNITSGQFQLYDLIADPNESRDVSSEQSEIYARMKQQLLDWNSSVDASFAGKDYSEGQVIPPDPESINWYDAPQYQSLLPEWKQRWEYESYLNRSTKQSKPAAKKKRIADN